MSVRIVGPEYYLVLDRPLKFGRRTVLSFVVSSVPLSNGQNVGSSTTGGLLQLS